MANIKSGKQSKFWSTALATSVLLSGCVPVKMPTIPAKTPSCEPVKTNRGDLLILLEEINSGNGQRCIYQNIELDHEGICAETKGDPNKLMGSFSTNFEYDEAGVESASMSCAYDENGDGGRDYSEDVEIYSAK